MYTHMLIKILSIFSEFNYFFMTVNVSKLIVMHFVLNMRQGNITKIAGVLKEEGYIWLWFSSIMNMDMYT